MARSGQRSATSAAVIARSADGVSSGKVIWATVDDTFAETVPAPEELVFTAKTILVLCGVPGAGKTFFAKRLLGAVPVLEADQFVKDREARGDFSAERYRMSVGDMLAQAELLCMEGEPVVVLDATAVSRRFRKFVVRMANKYGYAIDMIAFDATRDECREGQVSRGRVIEDEMQQVYEEEWDGLKWRITHGSLTGRSTGPTNEGFRSVVVLDRSSAGTVRSVSFA